jgi:hypothetical protein
MTNAAPPVPIPPTDPSDEGDWMRELVLRQLQMLGQLAEIGLEIAGAVERQAGGRASVPALSGDAALAYARVTRSVRQTMLLQSKLIEGLKAQDQVEGEARAKAEAEAVRSTPEYQRRVRVERIVGRLLVAEHPDGDDAEIDDLIMEAGERLDDEDLYGDLMERPVSELVARICRDLGLEPRWAELVQELWAQKEIETGAPGEPLKALIDGAPASLPRGQGAEDRKGPNASIRDSS